MQLILSNDLDLLFQEFAAQYKKGSPFDKTLVIVPSFATQYYFRRKLALDCHIFMNLEFAFLGSGIKKLVSLYYPELRFENPLSLSLLIEEKLYWILDSFPSLKDRDQKVYQPVYDYLKNSSSPHNITAFSDSLAAVFSQYGLYVTSIEEEWGKGEVQNWQQALWQKVSYPHDFLTRPSKVLALQAKEISSYQSVILFGLHVVPQVYYRILSEISHLTSVKVFQWTPTRLFWTDVRTPYEKSSLISKLKKAQAVKQEIESLSQYLSETNPLLASLGKGGRSWQQILEDSDFLEITERYRIPKKSLGYDPYRELHEGLDQELSDQEMSLLHYLQMDIFSLRKPKEVLSVKLDSSIQIHRTTTIQREVETLYYYLLELFSTQKNLLPKDVFILIPEIEKYCPYIESQFNNSPFDFIFHDYPYGARNSLLRGFFHLIDLVESRWDTESLFRLIQHPLFMARFSLSREMIEEWKRWAQETNIQWGLDSEHQIKILAGSKQELFGKKGSPKTSWKDFFEIILSRIALTQSNQPLEPSLNRLDFSSLSSLNSFAEILFSLRSDLEPLQNTKRATFEEWAHYMCAIVKVYFGEEFEESVEIKALNQRILQIAQLSLETKNIKVPFSTYWFYLKKDLSVFHTEIYHNQMEALSFYSLYSKPTCPAKVICILGLGEGLFPRNPMDNPLLKWDLFSQVQESPSIMDQDRFQFLELLLFAKERLYMSYVGYSIENHREQLPSLLITEFINYLDHYYMIEQKKPSHFIFHIEPHLNFDAQYFQSQGSHMQGFELAKNYYLSQKKMAQSKLSIELNTKPAFALSLAHFNQLKILDISQLIAFLRNPLQRALNDQFQIYIRDEKWENKQQNYRLSSLQKAILNKKHLQSSSFEMDSSSLPQGLFNELLKSELLEEAQNAKVFLDELGLNEEALYLIELREDYTKVERFSPTHWIFPAVEIKWSVDKSIWIKGVIEFVTPSGILSMGSKKMESIWSLWPSLLICSWLSRSFDFPFSSSLHFIKAHKSISFQIEDPVEELKSFIVYYLLGKNQMLPFLPAWIPAFTTQSLESLKIKIRGDLESDYFEDPYVKGLLKPNKLPDDENLLAWQKLSRALFSKTIISLDLEEL